MHALVDSLCAASSSTIGIPSKDKELVLVQPVDLALGIGLWLRALREGYDVFGFEFDVVEIADVPLEETSILIGRLACSSVLDKGGLHQRVQFVSIRRGCQAFKPLVRVSSRVRSHQGGEVDGPVDARNDGVRRGYRLDDFPLVNKMDVWRVLLTHPEGAILVHHQTLGIRVEMRVVCCYNRILDRIVVQFLDGTRIGS